VIQEPGLQFLENEISTQRTDCACAGKVLAFKRGDDVRDDGGTVVVKCLTGAELFDVVEILPRVSIVVNLKSRRGERRTFGEAVVTTS